MKQEERKVEGMKRKEYGIERKWGVEKRVEGKEVGKRGKKRMKGER